MNAAIYCRTATAGRGEPAALAAQEATCRAYADRRGLVPVTVVREVASGLADDRAGLAALREAITAGGIDLVLVTGLDRLSRDPRAGRRTIAAWEAAGVPVVVVEEGA